MMKIWVLLWASMLALAAARPSIDTNELNTTVKEVIPDIFMDTAELIAYYGYPVETHVVQTEDGYLLTMHRIPHGIGQDPKTVRQPVFLQHGLLCSSADWVVMGPGKGFAYILADAGYDVWLGNARGNTYSKKHVSLTPKDNEFWDFSWHEMGMYDLPAEIDHILEKTGKKQILYAGHSMGTTMFYVMGSLRPEYNNKIKAHFSLAPVAFMGRLISPIRLLSPFVDTIEWVIKFLGIGEFLPSSDLLNLIGAALCNDEAITQVICSNVFFLLCGYDSQQLNETMIPVIAGHSPAGASSKTLIHYAQEINSGKFRQYDYGLINNIKIYGKFTPPEYDLSFVTAPIYLHYSDNDWMANVKDVQKLYEKLPNVLGKFDVPFRKFNHLDFLWAIDSKSLLYSKIMGLMTRYKD